MGKTFVFYRIQMKKVVSDYIKNVDTYHVSFSWKWLRIEMLSPKSDWQTNMKWTVDELSANMTEIIQYAATCDSLYH